MRRDGGGRMVSALIPSVAGQREPSSPVLPVDTPRTVRTFLPRQALRGLRGPGLRPPRGSPRPRAGCALAQGHTAWMRFELVSGISHDLQWPLGAKVSLGHAR